MRKITSVAVILSALLLLTTSLIFWQDSPSPYPEAKIGSCPAQAQPIPLPFVAAVNNELLAAPYLPAAPPRNAAGPTPLPVVAGSVHAGPTQNLTLWGDVTIRRLYGRYDVDGNQLVVTGHVSPGATALLLVDLASGRVSPLVTVPERPYYGFINPLIDDGFVVWLDAEPDSDERFVRVFDCARSKIDTLGQGKIEAFDIRGDLVAWHQYSRPNIFLYNLRQEKLVAIEGGVNFTKGLRVCSDDWIAFIGNFDNFNYFNTLADADLSLRQLTTGKSITLGRLYEATIVPGERVYNFDCDAERLVWATRPAADDYARSELHIYDFATGKDSVIEPLPGDSGRYANFVLLGGDILLSRVGYDLAHQVPFSVALDRDSFSGWPVLANNRLIWIDTHDDPAGVFYVVTYAPGGD